MNEEKSAVIKKQFQDAVLGIVGKDRNHGWGLDDSSAVIETLIMENHADIAENKAASVELMKYVRQVINPSQFRQILESEGVLVKSESKREKREKLFGGLTS